MHQKFASQASHHWSPRIQSRLNGNQQKMQNLNVLWTIRGKFKVVVKVLQGERASTISPKDHGCFMYVQRTMLAMSVNLLLIRGLLVSKDELCIKSGAKTSLQVFHNLFVWQVLIGRGISKRDWELLKLLMVCI